MLGFLVPKVIFSITIFAMLGAVIVEQGHSRLFCVSSRTANGAKSRRRKGVHVADLGNQNDFCTFLTFRLDREIPIT